LLNRIDAQRLTSEGAVTTGGQCRHSSRHFKGIYVRWTGRSTLAEEIQEAYKDVSQVVEVMHEAGILKKVARIRPIVVVKGQPAVFHGG
jgi:RNA-splicing ligase RtcB